MTRPFAADDFPAIRARLAELQRDGIDVNGDASADPDLLAPIELGPGTAAAAGPRSPGHSELLPMQQALLKRLQAGAA